MNFRSGWFLTLLVAVTLVCSCEKSDKKDAESPYAGTWISEAQQFDDPYRDAMVSWPQSYLQIQITNDGKFTFYRKVQANSHYPSTSGTIFEASLKGSYNGNNFTITDVCNDDDGTWYGSVAAALDEANGGDDDKIEDASGINGFLAASFTVTITDGKLVINGIKFVKTTGLN
ncbi:MAG TPA: hypothetical protein VHO50_00880 [Bacteroidales bacterium]|nr:hypothetical protein [Bacteroidales bacterium]